MPPIKSRPTPLDREMHARYPQAPNGDKLWVPKKVLLQNSGRRHTYIGV